MSRDAWRRHASSIPASSTRTGPRGCPRKNQCSPSRRRPASTLVQRRAPRPARMPVAADGTYTWLSCTVAGGRRHKVSQSPWDCLPSHTAPVASHARPGACPPDALSEQTSGVQARPTCQQIPTSLGDGADRARDQWCSSGLTRKSALGRRAAMRAGRTAADSGAWDFGRSKLICPTLAPCLRGRYPGRLGVDAEKAAASFLASAARATTPHNLLSDLGDDDGRHCAAAASAPQRQLPVLAGVYAERCGERCLSTIGDGGGCWQRGRSSRAAERAARTC
jgi:hypothetical protein